MSGKRHYFQVWIFFFHYGRVLAVCSCFIGQVYARSRSFLVVNDDRACRLT